MSYGNYDLKRGDNDGKPCDATPKPPTWGGNAITSSPTTYQCSTPATGAAPTIGLPTHVKSLQDDLSELGFLIVGTADGDFGRGTDWAVREFQIYAKMTQIAKVKSGASYRNAAGDAFPANSNNTTVATIPNYSTNYTAAVAAVAASGSTPASPVVPAISKYVDSLESVINGHVYTGRISGVVNQSTRDAIEYWLENDYRCPVVIEAWNRSNGSRSALNKSNIWKYNDMTSTSPRIYFRDFTNIYTYPASKVQDQYHVISEYVSYLSWSGGRSLPPRHTWSEAEMLPSKLISSNITLQNFSLQTTQVKSTYRVIRAVSEVECIGFFDALNSYDNAFMSLGPCHWTLGIVSGSTVSNGELGGFLAYMRQNNPDAYNLAVGDYGLIPNKDWGVNGNTLYSSSSRKYTSWYKVEAEGGNNFLDVPKNEAEGNFLKTWHWYFRYSMAGRTIAEWQIGMWDMARIRLRDILNTAWSSTDTTKIGDIFTSEQAVAIILRWHIRYPAHMVSSAHAGTKLINTLSRAQTQANSLNWTIPKSSWTNAHETALCNALWHYAQQRSSGFETTISQVKAWPSYTGRAGRNYKFSNGEVLDSTSTPPITLQVNTLSTKRDSFELETI